jgi:hypothetical protein
MVTGYQRPYCPARGRQAQVGDVLRGMAAREVGGDE